MFMFKTMEIPFYVFVLFTFVYLLIGLGIGWFIHWVNRP